MQAIFGLVPQRRAFEAALDDLIKPGFVPEPQDARPVSNILVDGLGKRIRLLKDHPYPLAQFGNIETRIKDFQGADSDAPGNCDTIDQVVEAIETTQQRGFSAS